MGMLCSARELGLSEDHSGIMELDADLAPGASLTEALRFAGYHDRGGFGPRTGLIALRVLGIARRLPVYRPAPDPRKGSSGADRSDSFSVHIGRAQALPQVRGPGKLTNVRIGPSPWWFAASVLAVGMRANSTNIVDITQFVVMLGIWGRPLTPLILARLGRVGK